LPLQISERNVEDLHGVCAIDQAVTFGEAEQAQDLFGRGACTLTLLGIKRQFIDVLALHGKAQLALDERLHEQRKKVQREERFDAASSFRNTGAISCTVLTCSKRFSIIG
jgi:hypothetical protein